MRPGDAKILFIDADSHVRGTRSWSSGTGVVEHLTREGFEVMTPTNPGQALYQMYADLPDLVVLNDDLTVSNGEEIVRQIRADPVFRQLPILLLLPAETDVRVEAWAELQLTDFILFPVTPLEVCARIRLCLLRSHFELDANPLTRLPGNNVILKEIQRRIEAGPPFGLAYLDIDSFKAFNDRYGFARGDDVLKVTARIVLNAVVNFGSGSGFAGHIGGDDFVLLLPLQQIETACREIIAHFDLIVPSLYDEADCRQGFLLLKDRQGRPCRFPLMTLSIAVVPSEGRGFTHVGQIIARAAELKAAAKARSGSVYLIDRRLAQDTVDPKDVEGTANFSPAAQGSVQ